MKNPDLLSLSLLMCLLSSAASAQTFEPSTVDAAEAGSPPASSESATEQNQDVPPAAATPEGQRAPSATPAEAAKLAEPPTQAPNVGSVEAPAAEADSAAQEAADAAAQATILEQLQVTEGSASQRGVSLSGFMDVNYGHTFQAGKLLESWDHNDSFYMGRANVYFRSNITEELRSLIEVRFAYLPNGVPDGKGDYTRTAVKDYTDYNRPLNLGGIEIERAHGEYEFGQLLTVRVGQYLTPYGIWNVDHGSPAVIPVAIPYVIGQGLFPERQTGFELFGRYDLNDELQLQYHVTLSNGRGPFESHLDLDKNKAVGGRLKLVYQSRWGDVNLGASSYYGMNTDAKPKDLNTGMTTILLQANELAMAGDLRWTFKGIHVQTETVIKQSKYTEAGRQLRAPDGMSWGAYGLVGYRIPVLELMPFGKYERQDDEHIDLNSWCVGLNYRPLPELVLKVSGTWMTYLYEQLKATSTALDMQIAWAF